MSESTGGRPKNVLPILGNTRNVPKNAPFRKDAENPVSVTRIGVFV